MMMIKGYDAGHKEVSWRIEIQRTDRGDVAVSNRTSYSPGGMDILTVREVLDQIGINKEDCLKAFEEKES